MDVKEKRDKLFAYCKSTQCKNCTIKGTKWDQFIYEDGRACLCIEYATENDLDKALELINTEEDNVNHPNHYCTGKFECIEVMVETQGAEAVKDFCLCNAFKYLYRHNGKNGSEDIKKANWYLNKYLELDGVKQ